MLRTLALILSFALAGSALAHSDSKWTKGPQGGHVDAGGGKQHWELVAKGNELTLYVLDADEKPIKVDGGTAKGQVLLAGTKTYSVDFKPAGSNMLKATGDFTAAKGMRVIVKTEKVGGQSFQARLAPL